MVYNNNYNKQIKGMYMFSKGMLVLVVLVFMSMVAFIYKKRKDKKEKEKKELSRQFKENEKNKSLKTVNQKMRDGFHLEAIKELGNSIETLKENSSILEAEEGFEISETMTFEEILLTQEYMLMAREYLVLKAADQGTEVKETSERCYASLEEFLASKNVRLNENYKDLVNKEVEITSKAKEISSERVKYICIDRLVDHENEYAFSKRFIDNESDISATNGYAFAIPSTKKREVLLGKIEKKLNKHKTNNGYKLTERQLIQITEKLK